MMHQFRDKKQIERKKKIIRYIIVFLLLFILAITGILSWSGYIFNFIGRPVWEAERSTNSFLSDKNYLFRTKASLLKENYLLLEENTNIHLSMVDYQILKNDLDELKKIMGRISEADNFILGNILTKPNHSPYDTIIMDIGYNYNLKEGDKVYANGNIPIGIIAKVYDKTSLVSLYSSPGQRIEGFLNGTNASVELVGRGGGNFEMIVPIELGTEKGTIIYLPGNTSQVVAIVDEVISKPSDPFKKVILSSPVNVQNLKWVQVKK